MKLKKSLPGELRTSVSDLWREYKLIFAILIAALLLLGTAVISYGQTPVHRQVIAGSLSNTPRPVVNDGDKATVRFSDFRDKLLILDFWATYCGPCLQLLPRYDSLQKALGNRLQFLLVTHESRDKAAACLQAHHYRLPSVTGDTALAHAFPHNSIPFEVWLYRGRVIATTGGEAVTAAQIKNLLARAAKGTAALSRAAHAIPQKVAAAFDEDQPLHRQGNGGGAASTADAAPVLYQSLFTGYNPGLNSIAGIHRTPDRINIFALNASPLGLYHLAAKTIDPMLDVSNRYVMELPDSLSARVGAGADSKTPAAKNRPAPYTLCYNLVLPAGFRGDLGAYLLGDLNRFLRNYYGIEAVIQDRKVLCLVIKKLPDSAQAKLYMSPPGQATGAPGHPPRPAAAPAYHSDTDSTVLRGLPLAQLVLRLAYTYRHLPTPIVDETGITGPVSIRLRGNIADRAQLEKSLRENGLGLFEATRRIPMVVIRPAAPDSAQGGDPVLRGTAPDNTYPQTLTPKP